MEKIIINPHDSKAVEVRLNGQFAPYMGMNQLSYRQLIIKALIWKTTKALDAVVLQSMNLLDLNANAIKIFGKECKAKKTICKMHFAGCLLKLQPNS